MPEPNYDSMRDKELDEYLSRTEDIEDCEEIEGIEEPEDLGETDSPLPYNPLDAENRFMDFIN